MTRSNSAATEQAASPTVATPGSSNHFSATLTSSSTESGTDPESAPVSKLDESAPTSIASPSVHPSVVAVHGSAPVSPMTAALGQLRDSGSFPLFGRRRRGNNRSEGAIAEEPQFEADADGDRFETEQEQADSPGTEDGVNGDGHDGEVAAQNAFVEGFEADYKGKKNGRVIALDFDDVCAQNVLALITEHNAQYGTDLTLDDYQSYIIFQNRGWGPMAGVERKLKALGNLLPKTAPVPGFVPALRALHAMGHPLHIVIARPESDRPAVLEWLARQGITVGLNDDDVVAAAWFTNTYGDLGRADLGERRSTASGEAREDQLNEELREALKTKIEQGSGGKNKLKVLRAINASLFIDDHHGNLEPIRASDPPIPCLLFGPYAWNRSRSGLATPAEHLTFQEREAHGVPLPREPIEVGDNLWRADTWGDVIRWVGEWDELDVLGNN